MGKVILSFEENESVSTKKPSGLVTFFTMLSKFAYPLTIVIALLLFRDSMDLVIRSLKVKEISADGVTVRFRDLSGDVEKTTLTLLDVFYLLSTDSTVAFGVDHGKVDYNYDLLSTETVRTIESLKLKGLIEYSIERDKIPDPFKNHMILRPTKLGLNVIKGIKVQSTTAE